MKIIYPKTKHTDIVKAKEQILAGREKIYLETFFKDLDIISENEMIQDIKRVECELWSIIRKLTIPMVILPFCSMFFVHKYSSEVHLSPSQFMTIMAFLLPALACGIISVFLIKKINKNKERSHRVVRMERLTDLEYNFWENSLSYFDGAWAYLKKDEQYDILSERIRSGRDIIKCNDELYRLSEKLDQIDDKITKAAEVRAFLQNRKSKVNIKVFPATKGYNVHLTEEDRVSDSDNGNITLVGHELVFTVGEKEYRKIFAEDGVIDFSGFDKEADEWIADLYKLVNKAKPILEDKMPIWPDELRSKTEKCAYDII